MSRTRHPKFTGNPPRSVKRSERRKYRNLCRQLMREGWFLHLPPYHKMHFSEYYWYW